MYFCASPGCPGSVRPASEFPHTCKETPTKRHEPIELDIYEPHPEKPGYLRFVRMRSRGEVLEELNARLKELAHDSEEFPLAFSMWRYRWVRPSGEGLNWVPGHSEEIKEEEPLPRHRWLACFAVEGSNEGHYVHVEAMISNEHDDGYRTELLYLCKTFSGAEAALKLANAAAIELGAV